MNLGIDIGYSVKEIVMTASTPPSKEWSSPFDVILSRSSPQVDTPDPVFGTPNRDSVNWHGAQEGHDTCAIRCQEYIISQFTGYDPGEKQLVREATQHGWYHPGGGTAPADVGNLLETHHIPVNRYERATIFHLTNELAQGHKVIVGVHSDTLWRQHPILDAVGKVFGWNHADYAVVVSGIDTSNPEYVQVIISDPGTGQPIAHYPIDQFVNAWRGSDFFMVSTQQPPPQHLHLPEMVHFDYHLGHIEKVWGMSFEDFSNLARHPEQWDQALVNSVQELGTSRFGTHSPFDAPVTSPPDFLHETPGQEKHLSLLSHDLDSQWLHSETSWEQATFDNPTGNHET